MSTSPEGSKYRAELRECAAQDGAALAFFEGSVVRCESPFRFYWEQPERERAIVGLGALERVESSGPRRFSEVAAGLQSLAARVETPPGPGRARLVGGFAFEDEQARHGHSAEAAELEVWSRFADVSLVLPEWLYVREGKRAWVTQLVPAESASAPRELEAAAEQVAEPAIDCALQREAACASEYCARPDRPHARFLATLASATDDLRGGALEKVVVARSLQVQSDQDFNVPSLLASLRRVQPTSTLFAVARGPALFVGASPECLVRLEGKRVRTAALAGTCSRGRGPEEDAELARQLRESKKEQEEHAFVVREIDSALRPLCSVLERPEAPHVRPLGGLQHLETPFDGRLRDDLVPQPSLFDLVERLHPTPAVCGTPRAAALKWLQDNEDLERGWYAGAVGTADLDGGGELAVALRSGLVEGCAAQLYAGAGIVPDSDPRSELVETRLKLRTLLSQLTEI